MWLLSLGDFFFCFVCARVHLPTWGVQGTCFLSPLSTGDRCVVQAWHLHFSIALSLLDPVQRCLGLCGSLALSTLYGWCCQLPLFIRLRTIGYTWLCPYVFEVGCLGGCWVGLCMQIGNLGLQTGSR